MNRMTKKHSHPDLEALYTEADQADTDIFAEMRSNLLLIAGEHYSKKQAAFFKRIRDSKELADQQKLRLTKNHIQKITKLYVNNIVAMAPGVGFQPKNETETQDQKAAELHKAVWDDARDKYDIEALRDEWADDFVGIGEVATKVFFDPTAGDIVGYHQKVGMDGQPVFDEAGNPVPDEGAPVFKGEFMFEQVHAFNLLRAPEAKDMRKSPYLIIRKMVDKDELLAKFPDDEKRKLFAESMDETLVVFDGARNGYRKAKNEVLVREFYFRPCALYPQGYFYFTTKNGIFAEGELPGGVFPIVVGLFDRIQTTPRGRSPVKTMRPYQVEINRASSKIAEHQITLGDDKILIQKGTSISSGVALSGVRSINYTGIEPKVLAGRDGSQYLAYMQAQIAELYDVMMVKEDAEANPETGSKGQLDPFALLHRSASQKKRFQRHTKNFERFYKDVARTYLKLAKIHLPDDEMIYAVGRNEQVNISEFKNMNDLCYEVKIDAQSEDIESKLGKQMVLNHALQFVGSKLEKEDIGKLMRAMPYLNQEESFSDFTIDYDAATNDILSLDRGETGPISAYDNHPYMIKRLVARVRQPDFKYLPQPIQDAYAMKINLHQEAEAMRLEAIQKAQAGFIPTGGYLVVCDLYVPDPKDPAKTRRARLPYEALVWLIKKLETQGQSLEELEKMNQGALAQLAQMVPTQNPETQPQGQELVAQSAPGTAPPVGDMNVV